MRVRDEQSATLTCRRRLLCSGLCQAARPPSPEWCWSASPWAKAAAAAVELTDGGTQGERCEMWPWCTTVFTCSPWALWIEPPRSDAPSALGPWRRSPSLSRTVCKNNRCSVSVLISRFSQGSCSWSKVKPLKLLHQKCWFCVYLNIVKDIFLYSLSSNVNAAVVRLISPVWGFLFLLLIT